jgi:hypothetical protein
MTDERLREIRSLSLRFVPTLVKRALVDLEAEVRRLRAEARPEPIGYVEMHRYPDGEMLLRTCARQTLEQARIGTAPDWQVCALVPIEATP